MAACCWHCSCCWAVGIAAVSKETHPIRGVSGLKGERVSTWSGFGDGHRVDVGCGCAGVHQREIAGSETGEAVVGGAKVLEAGDGLNLVALGVDTVERLTELNKIVEIDVLIAVPRGGIGDALVGTQARGFGLELVEHEARLINGERGEVTGVDGLGPLRLRSRRSTR